MGAQDKEILKTIKSLSVFASSQVTFLDHLAQQSQVQKLQKAQVLFINEQEAERFYVVKKGWIKIFRETLDGTQAVVDILNEDSIFGETAIFQDDIYPYSAEATELSEVISMPIALLKQEIDDNPKFAFDMLASMARFRRLQDQELEHRTIQNASQRIGCFILRLADQGSDGKTVVNLPYDKTLVASLLGMQPETFSRALGKLKSETGITIKGATITMDDLSNLSNYSCAACSSEFPCKDIQKKSVI